MNKIKTKSVKTDSSVKLKILAYIMLFPIIYGVSKTSVYNASLTPFGIGIVFSMLPMGFNGYYLSIVYLLAYVCAKFSINGLLEAINVCLVLSGIQFVFKFRARKLKKWKYHLFSIIAQVVSVFINLGGVKQNLALFVSVVLGQFFLYACLTFTEALINKKSISKLSIDENICGGVVLIIFIAGLAITNISIINLGLIISIFLLLAFTYIFKTSGLIILTLLIGIGFSIIKLNPIYISMFLILSLVSYVFKSKYKFFSAIGVMLGFVLFNLFFSQGLSWGEILSVCIGSVLFILIPKKLLNIYCLNFNNKQEIVYNNFYNSEKRQLSNRLKELSKVFDEMTSVYKSMVRGVLDESNAILMLKEELKSMVCSKCSNHNNCFYMTDSFIDNCLDNIVSVAYEKDKILLIDMPQALTSNCIRVNHIINTLNELISTYKGYAKSVKNIDASRVLIADQLEGVSGLLVNLSDEVIKNINYNFKDVEKIKNKLENIGVECVDCSIYEKDLYNKSIVLFVVNNNINDKNIIYIVNKCLASRFQILSREELNAGKVLKLELEIAPKYDVAIGSSVRIKGGKKICGDTHSFCKVDNDKFMVTICDGMGSGEGAKNISSLTSSLIGYFYKAGFDNDVILSSINKLLSYSEYDNYSTMDLCVIDTKKNYYDFIKLGACNGYLKRENGAMEIIESNNLPIGILEDIRPHITHKIISPMDMLIFVSDGVYDAFANDINFVDFVSTIDIINPQTLSDAIMDKALSFSDGVPYDDMTVLCVRVFERI